MTCLHCTSPHVCNENSKQPNLCNKIKRTVDGGLAPGVTVDAAVVRREHKRRVDEQRVGRVRRWRAGGGRIGARPRRSAPGKRQVVGRQMAVLADGCARASPC